MMTYLTSHWVERLRYISVSLTEMPYESGYITYFSYKFDFYYERSVKCLSSHYRNRIITIIVL